MNSLSLLFLIFSDTVVTVGWNVMHVLIINVSSNVLLLGFVGQMCTVGTVGHVTNLDQWSLAQSQQWKCESICCTMLKWHQCSLRNLSVDNVNVHYVFKSHVNKRLYLFSHYHQKHTLNYSHLLIVFLYVHYVQGISRLQQYRNDKNAGNDKIKTEYNDLGVHIHNVMP